MRQGEACRAEHEKFAAPDLKLLDAAHETIVLMETLMTAPYKLCDKITAGEILLSKRKRASLSQGNMSPICFVSLDNLNRVPYISTYIDCFNTKFDIIYWNRSDSSDSFGEKRAYVYSKRVSSCGDGKKKVQKLAGYIGFKKFASKILRSNDYKLIVALTANCAVLLSDVLLGKYSGRYIIDIRDYWHEDFAPYHLLEEKLIKESAAAVISSPGYRSFLCDHPFLIMHNDQKIGANAWRGCKEKSSPPCPIVVASIGAMKNPEYDKKVIGYFANDARFELRLIGRGYELLREYCDERNITNVVIKGSFPITETMRQYEGVDVVLSMYGFRSPYWDYALSNKLYFAARLRLPILVCPETAMAEVVEGYKLGIALNLHDVSQKDKIMDLCSCKKRQQVLRGAEAFLDRVDSDNRQTVIALKAVLAKLDV